jgi:hypothetical protein
MVAPNLGVSGDGARWGAVFSWGRERPPFYILRDFNNMSFSLNRLTPQVSLKLPEQLALQRIRIFYEIMK